MSARRVGAVVPAAGSGTRLGAAEPKAFVPVSGRTMLDRCVAGLLGSGVVDHVVVVVPPELVDRARDLVGAGCDVVAGGAERTDSVRAGLEALDPGDRDLVLVHDAARCLTPAAVVHRVVEALDSGPRDGGAPALAVVPVLPVVDTVKTVDADGVVTGTPDRDSLRVVQTPQGFRAATLRAAHRAPGPGATDDAGLVERIGVAVHTVAGDPLAFKITTPGDLVRAEDLA